MVGFFSLSLGNITINTLLVMFKTYLFKYYEINGNYSFLFIIIMSLSVSPAALIIANFKKTKEWLFASIENENKK